MIKAEKAYLEDLARHNVCADDDGQLVVAWHPQEDGYVLRCGKGHYPEAIKRNPSLTQLWKQGEELPQPIKSNIQKGISRRAMQEGKQPTAVTFAGVPASDLGTGELLMPEVVKALVDYAYRYKLDPARGHVVLMYGKPYITLDGYLYHARISDVPFLMRSHPLTLSEREAYQVPEAAHAWLCEITLPVSGASVTGLGIVTREEMTAMSDRRPGQLRSPVVAAHPWQLAQKRAEWQALRRAFPIGETEEVKHSDTNDPGNQRGETEVV